MKQRLFIMLLLSALFGVGSLQATGGQEDAAVEYQFIGRHLVTSFHDCDDAALRNVEGIKAALNKAVEASGAHLLDQVGYVFPGDGFTMAMLLSESHASIHTYPEHKACFIDLFTCGTNCSAEAFEKVMIDYLKPQGVDSKIIDRD